MPAPDPTRPAPRSAGREPSAARDVSAIPAFLRDGTADRTARPARAAARPGGSSQRAATLPRPATPQQPPEEPPERRLDPASLPMPSLSRRRVITAAGVLLAGWLALSFVRQVGEATAAANRAAELRQQNAALEAQVAQLQDDLTHIQDDRYIMLAGRAFGLGGRGEVPFALAAGAPELAEDAPGSAAVRLGAEQVDRGPLDAWLEVLFGAE